MTGCERKSDPVINPETVACRGRHSARQRCVTKLLGLTVLLLAATPACGLRQDRSFVQCRHCSAMLSPSAKACPRCGEPTPVADIVVNSIGMKLMPIAAGRFRMGASDGDSTAGAEEKPAHTVDIPNPFLIGVTEVTQGQFTAIMEANPSAFASSGLRRQDVPDVNTDDFPVESVTWNEAVEFCDRLSQRLDERSRGRTYRLPTEAEWEFVATAAGIGATTRLPIPASRGTVPHPCRVGEGIANDVGLFDLAGNVSEWTSDWFSSEYYVTSTGRDPQGPKDGAVKSFRGGAWNGTPASMRPIARDGDVPDARRDDIGFRVVCVVQATGIGATREELPPQKAPRSPSQQPPFQPNALLAVAAWKRAVVRLAVRTPDGEGQGSGFVIDSKGTVVTNLHVVEDAISVDAFFSDGFHEGIEGVLGMMPEKDLAFLQLASGESRCDPLPLAEALPREGRQVYALGCPLGLGFSLTQGIVSGIRSAGELREAFRSAGTDPPTLDVQWIQTTAAVNWGNSGGPLIDETGKVVGVNTMVFGRDREGGVAEGLNFAVSSQDVLQAHRSLIDHAKPSSRR